MKGKFTEIKKKVRLIFNEEKSCRLLIAVSGGSDSMALLHYFLNEGYDIGAAHVNYGLRGKESDRDEQFVRAYCDEQGVRLFVLDAKGRMLKTSNLQEHAREIRYNFFYEIARKEKFDFILTAHHAHDNAETLLMNLIRGAGMHGLGGIRPRRDNVVRPFLLLSKEEIHAYLNSNHIPFVEDHSNATLDYTRNLIRHELLPLLEKYNPSVVSHLSKTAFIVNSYLEGNESLWKKNVKKYLKVKAASDIREFLHPKVKKSPSLPLWLYYEALRPFGINSSVFFDFIQSIQNPSGQIFRTGTHTLQTLKNKIIILPLNKKKKKEDVFITEGPEGPWPEFIRAERVIPEHDKLKMNKNTALFPLEKLKFPLYWRRARKGDAFVPFGMKGKKKIADFLKDEGIKAALKSRVWILTDANEEIIWVAGFRTTEHFRIQKGTNPECLELLMLENEAGLE
ncbi:MAG: tRNA lysidine(34) synthetase TilS [Bacteroidia bacterium]|nr:tRNA lysidine(34) synthetase TilS [Bacteroidia bacterium]